MGEIKDLIDLVTNLANSVKDRKAAEELSSILSMIAKLQSDQAKLHEVNIGLREERLSFLQQIQYLQERLKTQEEIEKRTGRLVAENEELKRIIAECRVEWGREGGREFKAGDAVRLKGDSGPNMVIEKIGVLYGDEDDELSAWCRWFGKEMKLEHGTFRLPMLEHVS